MKSKLNSETKALLERYFDAAGNLYGIIPLDKLLEIYNSQNEPISEEDFLSFVDEIDLEQKYFFIMGEDEFYDDVKNVPPIKRDLISEYILMEEKDPQYYKIKEAQIGKPYYVPAKEKLLKYEDSFYFEKTLSFISFRAFLRNQTNLTKEQADDVAEEIYCGANVHEGSVEDAFNMVNYFNRNLTGCDIDEFIRLFHDMYEDSRLHINRGHTPREMFKIR